MTHMIIENLNLAGFRIDCDEGDVGFKSVARIHLNSAVFSRQRSTSWNLPSMLCLKTRF